MRGYTNLTATLKEARVLGSEKLHVDDSDVDGWVVSLDYEPTRPLGNDGSAALQTPGFPLLTISRATEPFGWIRPVIRFTGMIRP
jgi:hypothetical protein